MPEYAEGFVPIEKPTDQPGEVMDTGTGLDRTLGAENGWQPNPNRFFQEKSQTNGFDDAFNEAIDEEALPENPGDNSPSEFIPEPTDSFQDTVNQVIDAEAAPENPEGDSSPDVVSELPEAVAQEQVLEGEDITESSNATEESTEDSTETPQTETVKATVAELVSPGLSEEQLKYAEALDAEIRDRELNPVEEENLRVTMALAEKYPNGLKRSIDKNGNHFAVIRESKANPQYPVTQLTIFCKKGVVTIPNVSLSNQSGANIGKISDLEKKDLVDYSELIDLTIDKASDHKLANLNYFNEKGDTMSVKSAREVTFELRNFEELYGGAKAELKKQMTEAENYQKSRKVSNLVDEL